MKRTLTILAATLIAQGSLSILLAAEDVTPEEKSGGAPGAAKRVPTPEEQAEKDARKACKQKICDIVASRDPTGEDVSCDIVKTGARRNRQDARRQDRLAVGKAVCQSRLELKRKDLALAMSEPAYDMIMPAQKVRCTFAQKEGGEPYAIEVTLAPRPNSRTARRPRPASNSATPRADLHLSIHLCRHRLRQLGQCARARGGAHDQRVHHQEMRRGEGGGADQALPVQPAASRSSLIRRDNSAGAATAAPAGRNSG